MPFIFAHPAIVLPLAHLSKRWVSITGLVIGSLTPDFEYLTRMKIQSNFSHTLLGLLWFDIPMGLLLAFIFHDIIRNSLFANLPKFLKSRFLIFSKFDWNKHFVKNWPVVLISILLGALSHLLWDAFTHDQGYFVKILPGLNNTVDVYGYQIFIYKILQHSSSLIGGLAIIFVLFKLPKASETNLIISLRYWMAVLFITLSVVVIRFLWSHNISLNGNLIVTILSALILGLLFTPILTTRINNWR